MTIPSEGGAFPILAQGEGTKLLGGIVLRTKDATIPPLSRTAPKLTASLDNTQELQLRAGKSLGTRNPDRNLLAALGGEMKTYVWTINGAAYPNRNSLDVRIGERVEIDLTNGTSMAHPMHLHGHDFQVLKIDGEKILGALRDTVVVPPGSKITAGFDTDNAGIWAFHCHLIYHLVTGMFTVLKYEGADVQYWQPEKQASELKN